MTPEFGCNVHCITLLWSLPCETFADGRGQPEKRLRVWLKISNQAGPLQMLGMKRELEPSYEPAVHYCNTSIKQTVRILLGVLVKSSSGKVVTTEVSDPDRRWPEQRAIPAGGDVWAYEPVLRSDSLAMTAKLARSPRVDARIVVLKVDFADGSMWKRDPDHETGLWTGAHAASQPDCNSADITDEEWESLTGIAYDPRWSHEIEDEYSRDVSEYALSCDIRPLGRGLTAFCPH